jgi:hypothetical protein
MNNPTEARPEYYSYLLRLWRTHSAGEPVWRASLQNPLTQEVVRFDDLPGLLAFLCAQIGQPGQGARVDGDKPLTGCS